MSSLSSWVAVATGGAIGASARYGVSLWITVPDGRWPIATLVVNGLGCLIAGVVTTLLIRHEIETGAPVLLITVGFLGAFTTFSAFSVEALRLVESGETAVAFGHVVANLTVSLAAVAVGAWLARALS